MSADDHKVTASFEQLLRPYMDRLYRLAFRLADNKAEAEDLFQDVLTKICVRIDDLADIEEPGSWLCRVIYNHFIDNKRRYVRQRLVVVEPGTAPVRSADLAAPPMPTSPGHRAGTGAC